MKRLLSVCCKVPSNWVQYRTINTHASQVYAAQCGLVYWETSAKENLNVTAVFEEMAFKLSTGAGVVVERDADVLDLEQVDDTRDRWSCCRVS